MRVIIIDGQNMLFRSGHVSKNLSANGMATGVAYHFLSFFIRTKKKFPDARFVVCWDSSRADLSWQKNWRVKIFPEYKSNRKLTSEMDKDVKKILAQKPMLDSLLLALGIPQFSVTGIEADDLIGMLAFVCKGSGWTPVVVSSDKDFLQLTVKGIDVVRPGPKNPKMAPVSDAEVFELFACTCADVLKVRAIAGDTGDGIPPAVPGIGHKRAAKLVDDGADPKLRKFSEHPVEVQELIAPLKAAWDRVHTNYRIMRILNRPDEKIVGKLTASIIRTGLHAVLQELRTPAVCDYQTLLSLLSEYKLHEALDERKFLRFIQRVS